MYTWDSSLVDNFVGWNPNEPRCFLNVWNQSTAEFESLGNLPDMVPWDELFQRLYVDKPAKSADDLRGNKQENYGFASNNNFARRTPENIRKHYGCNVPAMLEGTMDPLVVQTFIAMSELARKVGVTWTDKQFLSENKDVQERLDLFAKSIHENNIWELLSICFIVVGPDGKVSPHCDQQNCPSLEDVLINARLMQAPDGR